MSPQIETLIDIETSEKPFKFFYIQLEKQGVLDINKFDEQVKQLNHESFISHTKFIVYGKVMYVFPGDVVFPVFYEKMELKPELMLCAGRISINFAPQALKNESPKRNIYDNSESLESIADLSREKSNEYKLNRLSEFLKDFFIFQ